MNVIERDVPSGEVIHVILDNYSLHKHEKVRQWLAKEPKPFVWTADRNEIIAAVNRGHQTLRTHH